MKNTIFICAILWLFLPACTLSNKAIKVSHKLKAENALSLKMPDGDGYNGGGLAFDTKNKKYYAAFAGNKYFIMQAFDEKGKPVGETLKTRTDMRGLWYNPKTQQLEANGFGQNPVIKYIVNDGIPDGVETLIDNIQKPDAQCVATYDFAANEILMYAEGKVFRFDHKNGEALGDYVLKTPADAFGLNENTIAYTGIKDGEIAVLDAGAKKVYLCQKNTGEMMGTIELPQDAPTQKLFNFAFANRKIWLFDVENRTWKGYSVK